LLKLCFSVIHMHESYEHELNMYFICFIIRTRHVTGRSSTTAHTHMVENLYGCSIGTKSPYKYTEDLSRGEQMQMDIYKIPHTR